MTRARSRGSDRGGRGRRVVRGAGALLLVASVASCTLEPRTDANAQAAPDTQAAGEPDAHYREIVEPEGMARLPVFSSAVRNGDLLFLSGQIGAVPGVDPPRVVEGGVEAEARQALENIGTVLRSEGLGFANILKCTVFLDDIADFQAVNSVYVTYFPSDPPSRSALATGGLALGAKVEIECLAGYPPGR